MSLARTLLLRASESARLRRAIPHLPLARRAVARFMPGETLDAALDAAARFGEEGIPTVLTSLGENVTSEAEADAVRDHYVDAVERTAARGVDAYFSVKPTQLGLDLGDAGAAGRIGRVAAAAAGQGQPVFIDMEASPYTERTIALLEARIGENDNLGLCLQAYMRRTPTDLERVLDRTTRIRLVKGAYKEPPSVTLQSRAEIDARYLELARRILERAGELGGAAPAFGTHDLALVRRIADAAAEIGVPRDAFEIQMLYGIRPEDQRRLAAEGFRLRVLISYGSAWYPWFMRRLAEKPSNLLFVLRRG